MPERYENETLVAFVDISGFKLMMKNSKDAESCLKAFYSSGFQILKEYRQVRPYINGIFVSDCGILFVDNDNNNYDKEVCVKNLLKIIEELNSRMIRHDIMLTSSISYGMFKHINLEEHKYIEKMPFYGDGYLKAYLNAEIEKPNMEPGQCRIAKKEIPEEFLSYFSPNLRCVERGTLGLKTINEKYDDKFLYFYWMIKGTNNNRGEDEIIEDVKDFENKFTETYKYINKYRYPAMKDVLKNAMI